MKSLKSEDERTLLLKRKVQSDGFQLIIIYLLISMLIQNFFFNAPFPQIAVEFIGFVGASFYVVIRNILLGNNMYSEGSKVKKNIIRGTITSGLSTCIFLFILAGIRDITTLAFISVFAAIFYFIGSFLFYYLNKRKQDKIEEELNKDEDNFD